MKSIIFSVMRDPEHFLYIWLNYYAKYFDNILIIDNCSVNPIRKNYHQFKFDLETWGHKQFGDFVAHTLFVIEKQRELLKDYDVVVYADMDEIIYSTQCPLDTYIETMQSDYPRCTGYELIDVHSMPYTPSKTVMEQRKYWFYNPMYSKTLITRIPLDYSVGQHHHLDESVESDFLLLIHLHRLDFNLCYDRNLRQWERSLKDPECRWEQNLVGWQDKEIDINKFIDFYYRYPKDMKLEPIPNQLRKDNLF